MIDIEKTADRIHKGYKDHFNLVPVAGTRKMLRDFSNRFFVDEDIIIMFARLSQETFDKMDREKRIDVLCFSSIKSMLREEGPHTFLFFIVGGGVGKIKRAFDKLRGETISFYNRKMDLFIYKKRRASCLG